MLKPEENQIIQDYVAFIESLEEHDRQEAIEKTNDELEKIEGIQSRALVLPRQTPEIMEPPASGKPFCPHCGSSSVSRNGSVRGKARYICKDCRRSFGEGHGMVSWQSKSGQDVWDRYLEGMVCGDTLQDLADKCDISLSTAHKWRIKVFRTLLRSTEGERLRGTIQQDEWYLSASFKGNKRALSNLGVEDDGERVPDYQRYGFDGHPRKRGGGDTKRGLSKEKICIPSAVDSDGSFIGRPMGRGNVQQTFLDQFFDQRLEEDVILVTDKSKSGRAYAKAKKIAHIALDSKTESRQAGPYNLQTINSFHSILGEIAHSRRSFATKYIEEYLTWTAWQAKMQGTSVREKVKALKSLVPARGKHVLVQDVLKKEFPKELQTI